MNFLNEVITINWISKDYVSTGNFILKICKEEKSSLKFRELVLD